MRVGETKKFEFKVKLDNSSARYWTIGPYHKGEKNRLISMTVSVKYNLKS